MLFFYFWPSVLLQSKLSYNTLFKLSLVNLICVPIISNSTAITFFWYKHFHHISNDVLCLIAFCGWNEILFFFKQNSWWLCLAKIHFLDLFCFVILSYFISSMLCWIHKLWIMEEYSFLNPGDSKSCVKLFILFWLVCKIDELAFNSLIRISYLKSIHLCYLVKLKLYLFINSTFQMFNTFVQQRHIKLIKSDSKTIMI